jgi:hypothetical protein
MKTVSKTWLQIEVVRLTEYANDMLPSWVLLNTTDKYFKVMEDVVNLNRASNIKGIKERREFLLSHGLA